MQALKYYERSKHLLASGPVPKAERSALSRSRRAELLVHVTKRLEVIVAGAQRDEGGSTLVAGARARFASLSCEGEARLAEGEPLQALLAYEQALELGRSHLSLEEGGQLVVADTLTKLAEVHAFLGDAAQVEAHARAAIDLLNDVPSPGALLPRTPAERRVLTSNGHAEGTSQSGSSSPATPVDLSRGPERAEASGSDARQGRLSHLQAVLAQLETPSPARRTSTPRGGLGAAAGAGSAAPGMLSPPALRMSIGFGRATLLSAPASSGPPSSASAARSALSGVSSSALPPPPPPPPPGATPGSGPAGSPFSPFSPPPPPPPVDFVGIYHLGSEAGASPAVREGSPPLEAQQQEEQEGPEQEQGQEHEEDDEFAWRAGAEEDEEGAGEVDERVPLAIEAINQARELMTTDQVALDICKRKLESSEKHLSAELARLQEENADNLAKLAEYEMAKAASAEAAQAAEDAAASRGRTAASTELLHALQLQGASMRMAMELQKTFDALVPYFVYRSVLEQDLEDRRSELAAAQAEVRVSRRAYNAAMDTLQSISMEIQEEQSRARQKLREDGASAADGAVAEDEGTPDEAGGADPDATDTAGSADEEKVHRDPPAAFVDLDPGGL